MNNEEILEIAKDYWDDHYDEVELIQFALAMYNNGKESMRQQLAECEAECEEQARLNGMGSEREARLMARLEECERELDTVKQVEFPRKVEAVAEGWRKKLATVMKERDELVTLLDEAIQDISDWGAYASEYFQEKWNLNGCIEKYKAALAKVGADKTGEV